MKVLAISNVTANTSRLKRPDFSISNIHKLYTKRTQVFHFDFLVLLRYEKNLGLLTKTVKQGKSAKKCLSQESTEWRE